MKSTVLVMGLPGSGKTTVARCLANKRNGVHFSASGVLDDFAKVDPVTVGRWRLCWAKGEMAPDREVLPVLWNYYSKYRSSGPVILDGYPRTEGQLEDFCARGGTIEMVLLLETSAETARDRLLYRQSEESRADDEKSIIKSRIAQGQGQIEVLVSDQRIKSVLRVIECSRLTKEETLAKAISKYDSLFPAE